MKLVNVGKTVNNNRKIHEPGIKFYKKNPARIVTESINKYLANMFLACTIQGLVEFWFKIVQLLERAITCKTETEKYMQKIILSMDDSQRMKHQFFHMIAIIYVL